MARQNKAILMRIARLADELSESVTDRYRKVGEYPLNLPALYKVLNLKQRSRMVPWVQTGGFVELGGEKPEIYYSKHDGYTRRRYTILHEVAHWLLTQNSAMAGEIDEIAGSYPQAEERFCELFASATLMPRTEFTEAFARESNMQTGTLFSWDGPHVRFRTSSMRTLSKEFGVGFRALTHRIKALDLLAGSDIIVFCARVQENIFSGGDKKMRITCAAFDSDRYYIPPNKGLYGLEWKGHPAADILTFYESPLYIDQLLVSCRKGKGHRFTQHTLRCSGDYIAYAVKTRSIVAAYELLPDPESGKVNPP